MAAPDNGLGPPSGVFAPNPHPAFGGVPTEPLPPNHPLGKKPAPENYAERLLGLATVHPWMPHQSAATLAGMDMADESVSKIAVQLRNLAGSVDNTVKYVTDDPLLQKTPSLGMYVRSYLTNTVGPWPLADADVHDIQRNLIKDGYGKGLPVDGVWTTGWISAFNQYSENLRQQELGGANVLSLPFSKVLSGANAFLLKPALTAVAAYTVHLPSTVMSDVHTLAGSVGGTGYDVTHPQTFAHNPFGRLTGGLGQGEASASAAAENVLPGTHVTPAESYAAQPTRTQLMDTVQILGDFLAIHGLMRAGGAIAQAAGDSKWRSLDPAAAQKGPGTIAKTFFGRKGVYGDERKPLLSPNAAVNVPILRFNGPVADKIAGGDGYYYRARTLLRAPYAVPGVKTAATAVQQIGYAGAKIRGVGAAESLIGGQTSPLSNAINHMQAINQFDDAIQNRIHLNAFGAHLTPSLNMLSWMMYPQAGTTGSLSASIGKDITDLNTNVQEATGPSTGLGLSFERGVNTTSKGHQRISYNDMAEMAGGPQKLTQFIIAKTFEHVAAQMAEADWSKMPAQEQAFLVGPGHQFQDKAAWMTDQTNQYLHRAEAGNVSDLIQGAKRVASDSHPVADQWGGHGGFSRMIAGEIERNGEGPKAWLNKYLVPYDGASRWMRVVKAHRAELQYIDEANTPLGMVPDDYFFHDLATQDANTLEQNFNDAEKALANKNDTRPGKEKLGAWADARIAIQDSLREHYGIDGDHMPADDRALIELLHQKAEGQLVRPFPRMQATHVAPPDRPPRLVMTQPAGAAKLNRFTETPVFTKVKPSVAHELIQETSSPALHEWTNDRTLLPARGPVVTIEYEPADLHGQADVSRSNMDETGVVGLPPEDAAAMLEAGVPQEEIDKVSQRYKTAGTYVGNSQRYLANVDRPPGLHPHDAYDSVRSVELKPNMLKSGSKEGRAAQSLQNELEAAGFVKFDQGRGVVKWVRPDLVGGSIAASPELTQALAEMAKLHMTPVVGKALGSGYFDNPLFDIGDAHLTNSKRFIENAGLSPENIPSSDIGFTWRMNFHRLLVNAIETGKLKLFPTHTPETIIAMMRDSKALPGIPGLPSAIQQLSPLGRHAYDANLEQLTEHLMNTGGLTRAQATQKAAADMARDLQNPAGLIHVTKRDLKLALGGKVDISNMAQRQTALTAERLGLADKEMYDSHARDVIYNLIQQANAQQPIRLVGWQKAENLMALGLSYAFKPIPGSAGRALEYLPTRLVTLRNRARFTLSPEFQFRRVAKIGIKGMLDQIPFTWHPVRELMREGQKGFNEHMAYLDKIMPELKNPNYDEGTQAMYAEDPWGIYPGTRNYAAYFAMHWRAMGKTDTEIRQMLLRNVTYGSKAFGEGRSALERSMNFVFFPFSFDKTVYRNVGAYLLDHTAQRLVLQAGLAAYARYNASDPNGERLMSSSWWQDRLPLINEMLRLNVFQHGLGLGQFGGINAPLLNFFIPQSYASTNEGLALLRGVMPLVAEFQNIYKETLGTWQAESRWTADRLMDTPTLKGFKTKASETAAETMQAIFYAKPVPESNTATLIQAWQYRRKLEALFRPQVDYNAHAHGGQKLTLGTNKTEFNYFAGHIINATLVNDLVHLKYPAFNIADPAKLYDQGKADIETFSLQMSAQGRHDVVTWITDAQKMGTYLYSGKVDTATAAQYTKVYRLYAIEYAETVPGFLAFYNKNFRWQYGPLTKVR